MQTVFFVIIFTALTWARESSMLEKETDIKSLLKEDSSLVTLSGDRVNLAQKDKDAIVYFFAPWCNVCNFSIENLEDFSKKNPDYHVVAVALDYMSEDEVKEFTSRHQLTMPIALGTETIKNAFKVSGYPSYYVLNKKNEVISKSLGFSSEIGMIIRTL